MNDFQVGPGKCEECELRRQEIADLDKFMAASLRDVSFRLGELARFVDDVVEDEWGAK